MVKENPNGKHILRRLDAYTMICVRLLSCASACYYSKDTILLLMRRTEGAEGGSERGKAGLWRLGMDNWDDWEPDDQQTETGIRLQ